MPSDDVHDVFVDSKNRLWLATEQGVVMYANSQADGFDFEDAEWFTDRNGIPNLRCRVVSELNDKIFVGTWGGGLGIGDSNDLDLEWDVVGSAEGLAVTHERDILLAWIDTNGLYYGSWEYTKDRPEGWPGSGGPTSAWKTVEIVSR